MMFAKAGDWLLVESRTDHGHAQRAQILAVEHADGSPPYRVRWLDGGHEGLVFPGPDAQVLSAEQLAERDRQHEARIAEVQAEIIAEAAGR